MLTSHYMADVEALCERVIVVHHGRILFDGDLAALSDTVAAWKTHRSRARERSQRSLASYGKVIPPRLQPRSASCSTPKTRPRV